MKLKNFLKLYNIKQVNPHINCMCLEYSLVKVEQDTSYAECQNILAKMDLRGATMEEFTEWTGWDGKMQVVAIGGLPIKVEENGKEESLVPCLTLLCWCEPEKCYEERKLALLNIKFNWKPPFYLLAVREVNCKK